jgi:hypothetical protein
MVAKLCQNHKGNENKPTGTKNRHKWVTYSTSKDDKGGLSHRTRASFFPQRLAVCCFQT